MGKSHRCINELDQTLGLSGTFTAIGRDFVERLASYEVYGRQFRFFQLRCHATFSLVVGGPLARNSSFLCALKPVNATLRCNPFAGFILHIVGNWAVFEARSNAANSTSAQKSASADAASDMERAACSSDAQTRRDLSGNA